MIHWALYTRRPKDESGLHNTPSSEEEEEEEEEDIGQLLELSEYKLRQTGRHVFVDRDKAALWVFSLSHALDEDIARTLGLDGLESESSVSLYQVCLLTGLKGTSVGFMRSGDLFIAMTSNASAPPLIKTARSAQSTAKAIEELNTQAYGSNVSSNTQSSIIEPSYKAREASQNHSASQVYSNFTSAVSRSLSHVLGKRRGWVQVDPCACIDTRTLGDDLFDNSELHPWNPTTMKILFNVKWLSSGTMLISFYQSRLPRLIRMSKMLSRDGQSTGLAIGSPLLLSPFGIRCYYMGTEISLKSDVQRKSAMQMKASILSRLSHLGIRSVQKATWIHVQTGAGSNPSVGPPVSLWPADLCFCEDLMTLVSGEVGDSFERSLVDGSVDPLKEAESWFLERSARMEASRVRLLEQDQEAQALKDVEDTDDEGALSPFEIPVDQGITPQDVSGIYPTPPDGLPPALLGSSNPNNLQSGDYDDEEKELQPSDETRGDYDGQENDDLFGDIDIDMFASNGLTEADFSFFDDPGMIDEDLRETGQVMVLDDTNEATEHPIAFDRQGVTETPHGRGDIRSDQNVAEDQEDKIGVQGMIPCFQYVCSLIAPVCLQV